MIRAIKALPLAIQTLTAKLNHICETFAAYLDIIGSERLLCDRVEALERDRARWEAEVEGLVLKAQGQYKSAASSEQRERQMRKVRDSTDEGDLGSEEAIAEYARQLAHVPPSDVDAGQGQGLPSMYSGMEVGTAKDKNSLIRAKFGG